MLVEVHSQLFGILDLFSDLLFFLLDSLVFIFHRIVLLFHFLLFIEDSCLLSLQVCLLLLQNADFFDVEVDVGPILSHFAILMGNFFIENGIILNKFSDLSLGLCSYFVGGFKSVI